MAGPLAMAWMFNPAPTPTNPYLGARMAERLLEGRPTGSLFGGGTMRRNAQKRKRSTKRRKRNMALYRRKDGKFTSRKTRRRVRKKRRRRNPTSRKRRNPTKKRRNPTKGRKNPRRKRRKRKKLYRSPSSGRYTRRKPKKRRVRYKTGRKRGRSKRVRMRVAGRRGGWRNPRRKRRRRYYSNPRSRRRRYYRRRGRKNPRTIKGILKQTWRDVTSWGSIKQYIAGGAGILIANTGGGYVAAKIREWADQEAPGATLAKVGADGATNWIGVLFESGVKIATVSVATIAVPSKYRKSFMIGGAATALWDVMKLLFMEFAPDLSAQIGLSGWLTYDDLRSMGLSGTGEWLTDGDVAALAPRTNPQYVSIPNAQHQFSGA